MEPSTTGIKIDVQDCVFDATYKCIRIEGDLDVHTSPQLKHVLYGLIERGATLLVLNFDGIRYLDSAGLGTLLGAHRRVREGDGRMLLVCKSARIQRLFIITGLARIFDIFESEEKMERKLSHCA